MSQEQLEAAAGVSQSMISLLEAGRCPESVRIVLRIAAALDTSVEELFGQYAAHYVKRKARRRDITEGVGDSAPAEGSHAA